MKYSTAESFPLQGVSGMQFLHRRWARIVHFGKSGTMQFAPAGSHTDSHTTDTSYTEIVNA